MTKLMLRIYDFAAPLPSSLNHIDTARASVGAVLGSIGQKAVVKK